MWPGTPRRMNRSESTSMTSMALSLRSTRMARHSWVNSSMTLSIRTLSIMGAVLDEVVGPDVIAMLGPQPNAGAVREPQPPALGLLLGHFEPLAAPDPLDPYHGSVWWRVGWACDSRLRDERSALNGWDRATGRDRRDGHGTTPAGPA